MRIAVHAQVLSEKRLTGIGYYALHLLQALLKSDHVNEYLLFSSSALQHPLQTPNHITAPSFAFSYNAFPRAVKRFDCDLAFLPKEVVPFGLKVPKVMTVYDLYYLKCSKKRLSKRAWLHYYIASKLHFARADVILAISEDTKKDLIEMAGVDEKKIMVTPLGFDPSLFRPYDDELIECVKQKYGLSKPYFINTSSVWWERKNIVRQLIAFAHFLKETKQDYDLIITGNKGASYKQMCHTIDKYQLTARVHLLEYVPRVDLPCLLQGAEALLFASLHEGFGLPIIEAMGTGCPVICSNTSAMPELAADAALLVDPQDIESIQRAMERLCEKKIQEKFRQKSLQRAAQFSWNKTATLTLEAFRHVAG